MAEKKKKQGSSDLKRLLAEARDREKGYRRRALKLFPHICARCGRGFAGERLRELTVHHVDENPENNPIDGSNWELLCLYCHENEHSPYLTEEWFDEMRPGAEKKTQASFKPFADLKKKLEG